MTMNNYKNTKIIKQKILLKKKNWFSIQISSTKAWRFMNNYVYLRQDFIDIYDSNKKMIIYVFTDLCKQSIFFCIYSYLFSKI